MRHPSERRNLFTVEYLVPRILEMGVEYLKLAGLKPVGSLKSRGSLKSAESLKPIESLK